MNQNIQIRSVTSRNDMMNFIKFPWKVYSSDPNWVPPIIDHQKKFFNTEKNPFFKDNPTNFFLAYRNGDIVGRITAIINIRHNQIHGDKTGFFGFLEAVNDKIIFENLLNKVKDWLRNYGCDKMLGPVYPSINDQVGFLIDGYDSPPFIMLTHNPQYYPEIMESLGYEKAKDFYSYIVYRDGLLINERIRNIREHIFMRYPIKVRDIDINKIKSELESLREIYNDAWANHWGFVPLNSEEFTFKADELMKIFDPKLAIIVVFDDDPVAFAIALPNYNEVLIKIRDGRLFPFGLFKLLLYKKKIKGVRVITLGIKQNYQKFGLGSMFYMEVEKRIFERGYSHFEMSWVSEDNILMNRSARLLGGKLYKVYRIYQTPLNT